MAKKEGLKIYHETLKPSSFLEPMTRLELVTY
jgi:hypothetical protein